MSMSDSQGAAPAVFHETQELYRCGIHALNNVLQGASSYASSYVWRLRSTLV